MKLAFLIDRANFDSYCTHVPEGWEICHLGNGPVNEERLLASDAEAILCDPMVPISERVIRGLPHLKVIHSFGVGFDRIDLEAARERGICVCNNAGVNAAAVAEQTVLLMLAALRRYHEAEAMTYAARQGEFKGRCFKEGLVELSECSVGLLGLGAIGMETARRLALFGCTLYYHKRNPCPADVERQLHVTLAQREWILRNCDIISLHMPVTPETVGLINDETLALMKPGAILVNTARGDLVDQAAVVRSLERGQLGCFAADTLFPEPVRPDNPILCAPVSLRDRMALSPHIGGITAGTFRRSYAKAFANIEKALNGQRPGDIVNGL